MSMNPGQTNEPVGLDRLPGGTVDPSDRGDAAVLHRDVGSVPGIAGAVDDAAAADHEIEHRGSIMSACRQRPSGPSDTEPCSRSSSTARR